MYIETIEIENFKSFNSSKDSFNKNLIFVAGCNGSGKTNFLQAIKFALGEIKYNQNLINYKCNYAKVKLIFNDKNKRYVKERYIDRNGIDKCLRDELPKIKQEFPDIIDNFDVNLTRKEIKKRLCDLKNEKKQIFISLKDSNIDLTDEIQGFCFF